MCIASHLRYIVCKNMWDHEESGLSHAQNGLVNSYLNITIK